MKIDIEIYKNIIQSIIKLFRLIFIEILSLF